LQPAPILERLLDHIASLVIALLAALAPLAARRLAPALIRAAERWLRLGRCAHCGRTHRKPKLPPPQPPA
jgi:hypothetical protein